MINYELAKKLKDAGFSVRLILGAEKWNGEEVYFDGTLSDDGKKIGFIAPTLSELIEACGKNFGYLSPLRDIENESIIEWTAKDYRKPQTMGHSDGKTPEEAVANLWLKLNDKNPSGNSD